MTNIEDSHPLGRTDDNSNLQSIALTNSTRLLYKLLMFLFFLNVFYIFFYVFKLNIKIIKL